MEDSIFKLFIVGILWGGSNPFLKLATNKQKNRKLQKYSFMYELFGYLSNWHFILPFIVNQSGSLLFYYTLKNAEISLAVPIANGISLASTSIIGTWVGEEKPTMRNMLGVIFLLIGIICLLLDKKNINSE